MQGHVSSDDPRPRARPPPEAPTKTKPTQKLLHRARADIPQSQQRGADGRSAPARGLRRAAGTGSATPAGSSSVTSASVPATSRRPCSQRRARCQRSGDVTSSARQAALRFGFSAVEVRCFNSWATLASVANFHETMTVKFLEHAAAHRCRALLPHHERIQSRCTCKPRTMNRLMQVVHGLRGALTFSVLTWRGSGLILTAVDMLLQHRRRACLSGDHGAAEAFVSIAAKAI